MKLRLLSLIIFAFSTTISSAQSAEEPHPDFDDIYTFALADKIPEMISFLEGIPNPQLDSAQYEIKKTLLNRLVEKDLSDLPRTSSNELNTLLDLFHDYWIKIYHREIEGEAADSLIKENVAEYMYETKYKDENISLETLIDSSHQYIHKFIKSYGYQGNGMGKTSGVYDLFIWEYNDTKEYVVPLFYDTTDVTVHFMNDFITKGRLAFTTLDYYHPGGWATDSALYAMADSYDVNDPGFTYNYLYHEGQHFLDFQYFPELESPDLEYRAKLIELMYSEETFTSILQHFISFAERNPSNGHGMANWTVIWELSQEFFDMDFQDDKEAWKKIDKEVIASYARLLFDEHTNNLNSAGADTVTAWITLGHK